MDTPQVAEAIDRRRRLFIGRAAAIAAATPFGIVASAVAQPVKAKPSLIKPGTNTSLGALKNINAGVLNVAYAEAGPADGPRRHSSARLAL